MCLTYLSSNTTGKQLIYFSKIDNFLSLCNHSDFLKMHMHNAWLLGKTDVTMHLPSDYFVLSCLFFAELLNFLKFVIIAMQTTSIFIHFC